VPTEGVEIVGTVGIDTAPVGADDTERIGVETVGVDKPWAAPLHNDSAASANASAMAKRPELNEKRVNYPLQISALRHAGAEVGGAILELHRRGAVGVGASELMTSLCHRRVRGTEQQG
jgi:hypothetical protein